MHLTKRRFFILVISVVVSGVVLFQYESSRVATLKERYPAVHYRGQNEAPLITLEKTRPPGWVSLGGISRFAVDAIVVSEDWAFFQHKGYDPNQIREAIKEDWEDGRYARGASTITQQVVRNVFLAKKKTLWRKAEELSLSVLLEKKTSKRRILEIYLNVAEWGEGVFGIRAASAYYFHKAPSGLTAKEGAFLAMLLPSPIRYGVSFRDRHLTDYAQDTVESILDKMVQAHDLTADERRQQELIPLSFSEPTLFRK